jgi:hypothetical protein
MNSAILYRFCLPFGKAEACPPLAVMPQIQGDRG